MYFWFEYKQTNKQNNEIIYEQAKKKGIPEIENQSPKVNRSENRRKHEFTNKIN